jgi:hypothetical protein
MNASMACWLRMKDGESGSGCDGLNGGLDMAGILAV